MQLLALFDLDDTLIDRQGSLAGWARDFCLSRGLPAQAASLVQDMLRERAYPDDFDRLRACLGLADSVASLWDEYVAGIAARARCQPDLRGGLRVMRAEGWTLGVVTNGAADIQRAKLLSAGLLDLVDGVCTSEEVGARKPAPAVFQAAADECGASLTQSGWMIGDNPRTDIEGGRAVGLRTLWIASGRQWPQTVESPDAIAASAPEAVEYLLAWARSQVESQAS